MRHFIKITAMVGNLNARAQALFAISCAERVAPVFRRFGQPRSVETFERALAAAWAGVLKQDTVADAKSNLKLITHLPEAQEDDSWRSSYYAMLSLSVLAYAWEALAGNLPAAIEWASGAAISVYENADIIIEHTPPRSIGPGEEPPPPGPLERDEEQAQDATVEILLKNANVDERLCESIRELAREASAKLAEALPAVQRIMKWDSV
jgi:hypothetical protein